MSDDPSALDQLIGLKVLLQEQVISCTERAHHEQERQITQHKGREDRMVLEADIRQVLERIGVMRDQRQEEQKTTNVDTQTILDLLRTSHAEHMERIRGRFQELSSQRDEQHEALLREIHKSKARR
ncbi:hypothetical protein MIND_00839100 [Mycena indigotica]|uniref:Uncharacterized protein n=1 Tax=Mycena indigotica TaxID=2126181 RepID=A0A8H6SG63_9AGAR|nr:uncharacterized protein MIND_00839100 [Mycena indigotica]KAF7298911.1 hypothetical protein MIND_00839100 [Mycena indigotica]